MSKVTFQGQTVEAKSGQSLKEIVDANSWNIPFACGSGVCGVCTINIVSGFETLNPMSEQEKMTLSAMGLDDSKHRLMCQCQLGGGDVEISLS